MNRSTVEVPDENGKETRHDLSGFSHGCTKNSVQGKEPLDFDGTALNNSDNGPNILQRIIGKDAIQHPGHGTAEPEMRGLYMLLTMNNEGGMEVLKYAAKLFQERPEVYRSKPVQLALEIFKVGLQESEIVCIIACRVSKFVALFTTGKERLQLCSILLNTSISIHTISILLHHVQTRGIDAQDRFSDHEQVIWRAKEGHRRNNL